MNKNMIDMNLELTENQVVDNPFDAMMCHSLELTRELLFACHRLKNPNISKKFQTKEETLEKYMNRIRDEFSKLMNMSDETVAMCRETSYYYDNDKFTDLNTDLLKFERNMETVWTRSVPCRNDIFEQARLKKDSAEYKRLLKLRDIINTSEELSSVDDKYLSSLCDVVSDPELCLHYLMTKDELDKKQEIIQKYNLTLDDIEYMISYINREKRDKEG